MISWAFDLWGHHIRLQLFHALDWRWMPSFVSNLPWISFYYHGWGSSLRWLKFSFYIYCIRKNYEDGIYR